MKTTGFKALHEKLDWIAGPYSTDFGVIVCRKKCTEAESLRNFTIQHYNPASCVWVKRSEFESFTRDMMDYIEELSEELGEGLCVFGITEQAGKCIPCAINDQKDTNSE
jgi:hypothetical protein